MNLGDLCNTALWWKFLQYFCFETFLSVSVKKENLEYSYFFLNIISEIFKIDQQ